MVSYIFLFLAIAVLAGILGFGGVSATAGWAAQVLCMVLLVLCLGSLIRGRRSSS